MATAPVLGRVLDARAVVLVAGHLEVVTGALIAACSDGLPAGALVEIGAGTAHHLAQVRRRTGAATVMEVLQRLLCGMAGRGR